MYFLRLGRGPRAPDSHPPGAHDGECAERDKAKPDSGEQRAAEWLLRNLEQCAVEPGRLIGVGVKRGGNQKYADDGQYDGARGNTNAPQTLCPTELRSRPVS